MTVYTDTIKNDYIGDGVQTDFQYEFVVFLSEELKAYIDTVETTAFTVQGIGNDTGGVVTFDVAPADQSAVRLERVMPYHQIVDYEEYDPFPAKSHEMGLDRIVMLLQQVASDLGLVVTTSGEAGVVLPPYESGEYIRWAESEVQLVNGTPVAQTVNSATDGEAVDGGNTTDYVYSPAQLLLAANAHAHALVTSPPIELVGALPGTPDANTVYMIAGA